MPMQAPLRILYLVNAFEPDAPTRMMLEVAAAAVEDGYTCRMAALSRGGPLADAVGRVAPGSTCIGMRSLADLRGLHRLRLLLSEFRPHIFHVTLTRPTLVGLTLSALAVSTIRVATQHGLHEWREGGGLAGAIVPAWFRVLARRADAVVSVSEASRRQLVAAGVPEGVTRAIPNGVDTEAFCPARRLHRDGVLQGLFPGEDCEKALLIGAAGNLRAIKGHRCFVEAAARLAGAFPQARFVIWGEGPERPALEALVARAGLQARFRLPGRVDDMPGALAACDLFVQPSLEESFGLAAAEAMACEVPVVVSRTGGLADLVAHERSGLLVEPADPSGLAAAVEYMLRNPDWARQTASVARQEILAAYTLESMRLKYLELYRTLLQRSRED